MAATNTHILSGSKIWNDYPNIPQATVNHHLDNMIYILRKKKKLRQKHLQTFEKAIDVAKIIIQNRVDVIPRIRAKFLRVTKIVSKEKFIQLKSDDPIRKEMYNYVVEHMNVLFTNPNFFMEIAFQIQPGQIERVSKFISAFYKEYVPASAFFDLYEPLSHIKDRFEDDICERLPPFIIQYFSCSPRQMTSMVKKLVMATLLKIKEFVHDLKMAEEAIEKEGIVLSDLSEDMEQEQIIWQINHILSKKGHHPIVPNDFNKKIIHHNMLDIIQRALDKTVLEKDFDPEVAESIKLGKVLVYPFILLIINWIFMPYSIALTTNQLLDWDFSNLDMFVPQSGSPESKRKESEFCQEIVGVTIEMMQDLFHLGKSDDSLGMLSGIIFAGMKLFQDDIGKKIQSLFHTAFQSNHLIKGLLLADTLLFDHSTNPPRPTLVGMFQLSEQEKLKFQNEVKDKINNKLYPYLVSLIQSQSSAAGWALGKLSFVEKFCERLSQRLFRIGQQEYLLKILFFYIAEGYCNAAKEWSKK